MLPILLPCTLFAQADSLTTDRTANTRLKLLAIGGGTGYTATMIGLNELWYKNTPRQPFAFFNDNAEWKQVDKVGHFYSAFYLSFGMSRAYQWCGLSQKKSSIAGGVSGFTLMTPIEIMDGFSQAYGASAGDLIANTAGCAFFVGQSVLWNEIRIYPKFSFHRTDYASLRPNVLGDGLVSESLKDYNGQTYWLCFDMDKFVRFPEWLNLAAGYGADGLVYARDDQNHNAGYSGYRQYYLSLDFDLSALKPRSKLMKILVAAVNLVKLPAPAIEFSQNGARVHILYF